MSFYRITDDLPGMKGLIVKGEYIELYQSSHDPSGYGDGVLGLIEVEEIINLDAIVGDRQLKFPVAKGTLLINGHAVVPVEDPKLREFTTQSPFGEYQYEGSYKKNDIVVTYVRYENGISININEEFESGAGRTVYSQNFFGDNAGDAAEIVEQALRNDIDVEDVVFELKAISE